VALCVVGRRLKRGKCSVLKMGCIVLAVMYSGIKYGVRHYCVFVVQLIVNNFFAVNVKFFEWGEHWPLTVVCRISVHSSVGRRGCQLSKRCFV
jgi:uncharacterized integral membrane protein